MSKLNTPELEAYTVLDSKAKAAKIKHLKDAMIKLAKLFPSLRKADKLKKAIKGYAKEAGITSYEIEEPSRVVLSFVKGSQNSTKKKLLLALETVLGDQAEAQQFFDRLAAAVHTEGKNKGKPYLSFKDRSAYLKVGEQ